MTNHLILVDNEMFVYLMYNWNFFKASQVEKHCFRGTLKRSSNLKRGEIRRSLQNHKISQGPKEAQLPVSPLPYQLESARDPQSLRTLNQLLKYYLITFNNRKAKLDVIKTCNRSPDPLPLN